MNNSINKINAFQERELKSKIIALLVRTKKISKFSSEIIENKELRRSQLFQLDRLEGEAVQLLEQVNLEIGELLENEDNTTFEKYKETTYELKKLIQSQQVIATTLEKISSLIYFFYQGEISLEISYSMFETYVEQSNKIRLKLNNWHERQIQNLGIELDTNKIVKSGLEGAVSYVPSFFNNQWRYKELPLELHDEIINQSQGSNLQIDKPEDVFDSDVQIIVKDGKYYYLHE